MRTESNLQHRQTGIRAWLLIIPLLAACELEEREKPVLKIPDKNSNWAFQKTAKSSSPDSALCLSTAYAIAREEVENAVRKKMSQTISALDSQALHFQVRKRLLEQHLVLEFKLYRRILSREALQWRENHQYVCEARAGLRAPDLLQELVPHMDSSPEMAARILEWEELQNWQMSALLQERIEGKKSGLGIRF